VDGVILVIDSQKEVYDRNLASWNELISYFRGSTEDEKVLLNIKLSVFLE